MRAQAANAQRWLEGYTRAVEIHEQDWQELNELHTEAAASLLALHTMRDSKLHRELHIDMPGPEDLKKHPELITELVTGIYRRFHAAVDDDLDLDDDEPVPWLDFSDDELADMDESLLMDIVTSSDDVLPLEVVRECASRGDAMVPLLRQHLENESHWTEGVDESDWWGLLHAIFILGLIPGESSAHTLLHAFRKVNFDENNNLSDWLSACWPALCRNKREFTTVPLREIAENRRLRWYARSQAVDCVLADAADSGTDALEDAVDWLARMCGDDSEDAENGTSPTDVFKPTGENRRRPAATILAPAAAAGNTRNAASALRADVTPRTHRLGPGHRPARPEISATRIRDGHFGGLCSNRASRGLLHVMRRALRRRRGVMKQAGENRIRLDAQIAELLRYPVCREKSAEHGTR